MTWTICVGDENATEGITVDSYEGIRAAVAGVLVGHGIAWPMALTFGRVAVQQAHHQQETRRFWANTPPLAHQHRLDEARVITVRSSDLPEDPKRYCDGRTDEGNRCPRHLNHLGSC